MQEESLAAVLGLVLMTQPNNEVRIPLDVIEKGLPQDSGVKIFQSPVTEELVVQIAKVGE